MNITVVGMIKNSADIIETFIRGNGLFADKFILIDNNSTDNTLKILNNLINEGYDISIYSDYENAYVQSMKMNILIRNIIRNHSVDWIIPLDDDEILISRNGGNVRDIIGNWDLGCAYFAKWRIFVPTELDNKEEKCVIKRIRYYFADSLVTEKKVIFSNVAALSEDFRIVQGNHDFIGPDIPKISQEELIIAHYPVRSKEQISSKALIGWTNYLAMPNRVDSNGAHWREIYELCKNNNDISIDMLWKICMLYLNKDLNKVTIDLGYNASLIDEDALDIKYTKANEINPLLNYINNTEQLAMNYAKLLENKDAFINSVRN